MKYQELIILLPCHSLEDFPLHHEGIEAEGLLGCWTAMWHPALLASSQSIPTISRVDDPPEELTDRLLVVPPVSEEEMLAGLASRAANEGAVMIRSHHDRNQVIEEALANLEGGGQNVDADLAADFLALGFCYLQVELFTRQMRYSSNLDEVYFQNQAVAAAQAAMAGEEDKARELLTSCFDVLGEERDHYYPVDAFLLDLTLVASTTLGSSLRHELECGQPVNVLLCAELLAQMAQQQPKTLEALRAALEQDMAAIIGGEFADGQLPLYQPESICRQLMQGLAVYEKHLGSKPGVFGRRRYGLTPVLPQILHKIGFDAALHATLDDGQFPEGSQAKIHWEGIDGTAIEALARAPLDATKPETFLSFSSKMGESMDMDHVAILVLAHWPGIASPWHDDLRRVARYTNALGKFITIDQYFRDTDHASQLDRFHAGQYRSPYLTQDVLRQKVDPISRCMRYQRRHIMAQAQQSLATLVSLLREDGSKLFPTHLAEIDRAIEDDTTDIALDEQLTQGYNSASEAFATAVARSTDKGSQGYLLVNPCSFARRELVELPQLEGLPTTEKPVYAAAESGGRTHVVVDIPPLGFAWVGTESNAVPHQRRLASLAEENVLRNEFLEARINPTTGSLQSIHDYQHRANRLSQQLALRMSGGSDNANTRAGQAAGYSVMVAESVEVTAADTARGEIVSRGRLVDRQGQRLAGFQQTYRLWRGSRVLHLEIELEPEQDLEADPWNSYYACRFAWADAGADLMRGVNFARQTAVSKRFEAPLYVEIDMPNRKTAILTGGLPYHLRVGMKMLDSLLIVRGERTRQFHLGIGVDVKNPLQEAIGFLLPTPSVQRSAAPSSGSRSGWLFHVDARNVLVTHWEPLIEEARICGFRARLLETAGRPANLSLRTFRPVASARRIDFQARTLGDCRVEGDAIDLELGGHEWIELEARWQR